MRVLVYVSFQSARVCVHASSVIDSDRSCLRVIDFQRVHQRDSVASLRLRVVLSGGQVLPSVNVPERSALSNSLQDVY